MSLTKEQILKADDLKTVRVDVPEWGGEVYIKTMTGEERDAFEASLIVNKKVDLNNVRAKLCVQVILNDKGEKIFNESDIERLGKKSSKPLDRIFTQAQQLSGISKGDIEEMAKNSGLGLSEDSISD